MTPVAILIPALEGDTDAQAMLADYLKEQGIADNIAEECYFGAIHIRNGYHGGWRTPEVNSSSLGFGAGYGSRLGLGAGQGTLGVGAGRGSGEGYG